MMAPARFARSWRDRAENGQPITHANPAEARRTPHGASISAAEDRIGPDQADGAPQVAPAVPLRSPSGLAPRDGDPAAYDARPTHQSISRALPLTAHFGATGTPSGTA